jgi:hypothetical protein
MRARLWMALRAIAALLGFVLLQAPIAAQGCWYSVWGYDDWYDNGIDMVYVYGTAFDDSDCPWCYHSDHTVTLAAYGPNGSAWNSFPGGSGGLSLSVQTSGSVEYYGDFGLWCSCAGSLYENLFSVVRTVVRQPPPSISGPTTIERGQQATFTLQNAAPGTASNWRYETGQHGTVVRVVGDSTSQWTGEMVMSGTVRVMVAGVEATPLQVTVTPRSGWAWQPVSPQKVGVGFQSPNPNSPPMTLADPPTGPEPPTVGRGGIDISWSGLVRLIPDDGPNRHSIYTTQLQAANATYPTAYYWTIATQIESINFAFAQAQTGTYDPENPQANPQGCIWWEDLLVNTIRHEVHPNAHSHYSQYVDELAKPERNLGTVAEAFVQRTPATTESYTTDLNSLLISHANLIVQATLPHPIGIDRDADNRFLGHINWAPGYNHCF